jgi:long-chain fatty acid transport protein
MRYKLNQIVGAAALGAALLASADAQAGGFAIREQSAVGAGDAFAGEGTTGMGLSAMFWNPAAVTQVTGFAFEGHSSLIMPNSSITTNAFLTSQALNVLDQSCGTPTGCFPGGSHQIGVPAYVGAAYMAMKLNPNWYLGVSVDAPFGLSTNQGGAPQAAQQLGLRASVFSIEVNPVIGWKLNDMVSIAAGPRATIVQGWFGRAIFAVPPGGPAAQGGGNFHSPVELDVFDVGFGFTAGITVKPWAGTELSLGYRSQERLKLAGQNIFTANLFAAAVIPQFNGTTNNLTSSETLPDQVTFGVSQRITDTFTLLGTVEWTHWSILQNIPFTYTSGPAPGTTATTLNFNFRDGWFFSLGGEYKWDPQTTLRAGLAYEISPVTDQFRDVNLPDSNRVWLSTGLTRYLGKGITVDFGYSYIMFAAAPINVCGPPQVPFANPILNDTSPLRCATQHPDQLNLVTQGQLSTYSGVAHTSIQVVSLALRKTLEPDVVVTKY